MYDLENKVALVTGGSRGIGREIALSLKNMGASVIIVSTSSSDEDEDKEGFTRYQGDVSKEEDVSSVIAKSVKKFGKIDILVNNAGITKDGLSIRMSENDWNSVLNINLKGTFLMSKAAVKHMIKQKSGKIINISSIIGLIGNVGQVNYAASKAGIIAITKSMALEMGGRGININAVAPGFVETDMTDAMPEKIREKMLLKIPLKRFGVSQDVANIVSFLASASSDYITGQVFVVDGGLTMTG